MVMRATECEYGSDERCGGYAKEAKELAIMPMVESVEGVRNAEAILRVKGVTGCFIGLYDIWQSLGLVRGDSEELQ